MSNFQDLSTRQFHNLTVTLERETRLSSGRNRIFWKCICKCGKETWVHSNSLITGHTKSCGCLSGSNVKLPEGQAHKNAIYLQAKLGARARHINWQLTKKQYFTKAMNACFYCGAQPTIRTPSRNKLNGLIKTHGLDRLDNNKGYSEDNCVACCWKHNRMKGEMSYEEFIRECRFITRRAENAINNGPDTSNRS